MSDPVMLYFQILFRTSSGGQTLTGSIAMLNRPGLRPEDCLHYTTDYVRENMISIWEVAS